MDPTRLIGPPSPLGYPAPYLLLVILKTLGFTLHAFPMNLWYAGTPLAMLLAWRGGEHGKRLSARLMNQMPVIIALGINLGVIPLLFIQVAYYRAFYPATILMAWPWFAIIALVTLAYYGVYLYAIGLRHHRLTSIQRVSGWVAALAFLLIGFTFANGLSLMTNVHGWPALWEATSLAGAPLGTGLNTSDPTLWPRWLMMFGLAITTAAAYSTVDAGLFAGGESDDYRAWIPGFAIKLYTAGILWFAVAGSWYVFGTWRAEVRSMMFGGPLLALTSLAALGPGLVWLLIRAQRRGPTPTLALCTGLAQLGVLALNAVSRQVVQNAELSPFLDVTAEPVRMQWSPLILFLVLLALGIVLLVWMIRKVVAAVQADRAPAR